MQESFVSRLWHRLEQQIHERTPSVNLFRSGVATLILLSFVLLLFGVIWHQHERGRLHRYNKLAENTQPVDTYTDPRPGGQEVITLRRSAILSAMVPEFVSMDLLPGVGMEPLQITVNVPDHGQLPLLVGTPVNSSEAALSKDSLLASPFLVLTDAHSDRHALEYNGGILQNRPASRVENEVMPDGGHATAHFYPVPGDGAQGQGLETQVAALFSGREVELTVSVHNVSSVARPVAIAWMGSFAAPQDGSLANLRLSLPTSDRVDGTDYRTVHGTEEDFSAPSGARLGSGAHDVTYAHLRHDFLSVGPEVKIFNDKNGNVLRLTALTASIDMLRLQTLPGGKAVVLAFGTPGAFATRLHDDTTKPTMLEPGAQLEWKVRLEISSSSSFHSVPSFRAPMLR